MTLTIKTGTLVTEAFSVISKTDGVSRVSGESTFTVLISKDGVSQTISYTITEIGVSGVYCFSFTPNSSGLWHVEIQDSQDRIHGSDYDCIANDLADVYNLIADVWKIETGRWKINTTTKQMTFYDTDGTTPLYTFNLYNTTGGLDTDNVYERRQA